MTTTEQTLTPTGRSPSRVSRFAGLAFAAPFVAGLVVLILQPNVYEGSLENYAASYAESGAINRIGAAAYILFPLAGALLLWAVAHIRSGLDRAAGGSTTAGRTAVLGAVVTATAMTAAACGFLAAAHVALGESEGFDPEPAVGYGLEIFAGTLMWVGLWGASLVMVAVGLAARGTGLVPGWLLWAGVVAAPLLPVAWMLAMVPMLVFLLWVAIVSFLVKTEDVAAG